MRKLSHSGCRYSFKFGFGYVSSSSNLLTRGSSDRSMKCISRPMLGNCHVVGWTASRVPNPRLGKTNRDENDTSKEVKAAKNAIENKGIKASPTKNKISMSYSMRMRT